MRVEEGRKLRLEKIWREIRELRRKGGEKRKNSEGREGVNTGIERGRKEGNENREEKVGGGGRSVKGGYGGRWER